MTDTTTPASTTAAPAAVATPAPVSAAPAAAKTSRISKILTAIKSTIASVFAWIKAKVFGAAASNTSTATSTTTTSSGALATAEADVSASYAATKSNRASWLFVGILVAIGALAGFFSGHHIAAHGVAALKDRLTTITAERDQATTAIGLKTKELAKTNAELAAANDEIKALKNPAPSASSAPAPAAAAPAPASQASPVRPTPRVHRPGARAKAPAKGEPTFAFPLPFGGV